MKIKRLKTNHITNPMGFELSHLTLSWVTSDTMSISQKAARVEIAADKAFKRIVFDSQKSPDIQSNCFKPNIKLTPKTRYFWRVTVWGNEGDCATSKVAFFETSKMDEPWTGKWIAPVWEDKNRHPYFEKQFILHKKAKNARVYISGLGAYNLEINGHKVGDEYLAPGCNAYDRWIQYQTYDVTKYLKSGTNTIGALMGNSWAKGRFGFLDKIGSNYTDTFCLICELYVDGKLIVASDESFTVTDSPIVSGNIHDGEVYDERVVKKAHDKVKIYDPQLGPLVNRYSLPVRVKKYLKPKALIHTPKGETVIDMGQNMVGWLRFKVDLPKGSQITLQHGEIMQEGCFYNDNLRSAKATYTYISDGKQRVVEPKFTFFGFRYVKVSGASDIDLADFIGCAVYSDMDEIGTIKSSDKMLNKLISNALWSQRDNFLDVPTDCPQRDERMGWTGDVQIFAGTALYNMDCYAFFTKFLKDLYEEQLLHDGAVTTIVPVIAPKKRVPIPHLILNSGIAAWGDSATVIPWQTYLHSGDRTILQRQYDSMTAWVDWITKEDEKYGKRNLWITPTLQLGDWLALDGPHPLKPQGGTDTGFIASAYYYYSALLTGKAAAVLCKETEADKYLKLAADIKKAFINEFYNKEGNLKIDTQTAYSLAIFLDLLPKNGQKTVQKAFKNRLKQDNFYLKTGFVGTPYLCFALSSIGLHDIACRLLFNKEFPSWLFEVRMGATTVWERWNSVEPSGKISDTGMNSLNHYAYGSVVEWIYKVLCGLSPSEVGSFREAVFAPKPCKQLKHISCKVDTLFGTFECGWKQNGDKYIYNITVPFNCVANVSLPSGTKIKVTSGRHTFEE